MNSQTWYALLLHSSLHLLLVDPGSDPAASSPSSFHPDSPVKLPAINLLLPRRAEPDEVGFQRAGRRGSRHGGLAKEVQQHLAPQGEREILRRSLQLSDAWNPIPGEILPPDGGVDEHLGLAIARQGAPLGLGMVASDTQPAELPELRSSRRRKGSGRLLPPKPHQELRYDGLHPDPGSRR